MKLELYHLWHCPYSAKVRDYIEKNNLEKQIDYREVDEDDEASEMLMELTGKSQVPCLVIDDKPMLESDDIISWLKENMSGNELRSSSVM